MQQDPTSATVNDSLGVKMKKRDADDDTPLLASVTSYGGGFSNLWLDAGVLKNTYIYTAIKKISTDVASQRFIYDDESNNRLLRLLNRQPNENINAFDFWSSLVATALLNGMSFAYIDRTGNRVSSLTPIPIERMTVKVDSVTNKASYILDNEKKLDPNNLLIIKFFSTDGITGISPIQALNDQLNIQKNKNKLLNKFFSNGYLGRQILKRTDNSGDALDPDAKANIREKFQEVNRDDLSAPIIVDKQFELSSLPINEQIVTVANQQEWSVRDISACFNLPSYYLGLEDEHSNNQQASTLWLQQGLVGYFAPIVSEINSKLVPQGHTVDVDFSKLFSASASDNLALEQQRFELAKAEYDANLISFAEFREKMNLPIEKKGDE